MKLLKSAIAGKIAGSRVSRWLFVLWMFGGLLLLSSTVVQAQTEEVEPFTPDAAEAWDAALREDVQLAAGAPAGAFTFLAGDPQTAAPAETLAVADWAHVPVWGNGADQGRRPSIGIHPSSNRPFVSFYGGVDSGLWLAWRTGNVADTCGDLRGWRCTNPHNTASAGYNSALAFYQDGSGRLAVAHTVPNQKTLLRGRFDADGFLIQGDSVQQLSMNDSASYIDLGDLVFQGSAAIWTSEIFDAGSAFKRLLVIDERFDGGYALVEQSNTTTSNKLGRYAALDLGAGYNAINGNPLDGMTQRVAYSGVSGVLRYAEWRYDGDGNGCQGQTIKWICRTVDHSALVHAASLYAPKCANCASDRTRIAYFDAATGKLKLATQVGGGAVCNAGSAPGWQCQVIDAIAANKTPDGIRVSMVVQNGQIKIAYTDKDSQANSILKLATYTGAPADVCVAGGAPGWKCEVVDNGDNQENTGIEPSLSWVGNQVYIAYHNLTQGRLMVAHPKVGLAAQVSFKLNMPVAPVAPGEDFTFTYGIDNKSATTLTGLEFKDYLSIAYDLKSVESNSCSGMATIDPGNLTTAVRLVGGGAAPNAACTVTLRAQMRGGTAAGVFAETPNLPLTSHETYPVTGSGSSLTVKLRQTITFVPIASHTYGDAPFAVNAPASSGLPVTFSTLAPAVCTVNGNVVTLIGADALCHLKAVQAGNAQYFPADAAYQFFVAKRGQAITFAALGDKVLGSAPFAVSATSSAGLPVSLASTTPAVCTLAGVMVTLVSTGTCSLAASQPGNATTLAAAAVSRQFAVTNPAKQNQTISFAALSDRQLGAAPFVVSASTTSGLPVTFASNTPGVCTVATTTVTLVAPGLCTVTATQGGNNSFNPAPPMSRTFTIQSAPLAKIFLPVIKR